MSPSAARRHRTRSTSPTRGSAILQFAYQLELLEGTFHDEGIKAGLFKDAFLDQKAAIRDHEMALAGAIAQTLGQLGAEVREHVHCGSPHRVPRHGFIIRLLSHQVKVSPDNVEIMEPKDGGSLVLLQTCTLPDYRKRLIVHGELVRTSA